MMKVVPPKHRECMFFEMKQGVGISNLPNHCDLLEKDVDPEGNASDCPKFHRENKGVELA